MEEISKRKSKDVNIPPFVSIIIPVYNDPERLRICLEALEDQTYPKEKYEVIVVDNGSDESIEPIVAEFRQAKASYEARPGSYAARNKGISLAQGEIFAFTDSDCIPAQDWIEKGVGKLLDMSNCGIVGGKLEPRFQNSKHPTAIELYEVIMYYCQKRFVEVMHFSVTANLFTFRHIVEHVGPFDGELKSGGDREWGQRVASFGYQLIYADDVRIVHPARATLAQLQKKERRIARGVQHLRQKSRTPSYLQIYWNSLIELLPPLRSVLRIRQTQPVERKEQLKIIGIWLLMKYVAIQERLRAKLRQKSLKNSCYGNGE